MEAVGGKVLNWTAGKVQNYWNLDDNLKSLEKELQRLSDRKSDTELEVIHTERSGAKKRKREVNSWFEEVGETKNDFNALKNSVEEGGFRENAIRSGKRVEKIRTRVKELVEQSLHFDKLCLNAFGNRSKPRVTEKLFGEKFDDGLKRILAWLETDNISNIGIYGMGGVGKTTLAKHIHDHLLKNSNFKIYWVTVSQEFNIKKLQDDIAKCLELDPWNEDDEHIRAAILSEGLVQGSVLILDDVWKEIPLKEIGICHGANKCRLIFTTRSRQVCTGMDCQRELEVKTLDKNESWDLFKTTLRLKTELPADIEKVAKCVTERCAGLPLGIVTVAGSMKGVTDIREWRNALEQLKACSVGHDKMEEKVFPILEWSFNRLNEYESHCFLYCSLYQEDSKLKIKELIDLFIWAELMQERKSWSQEFDQGHAILNKLIKVCLLEETRDFKGDDCVKMHDLVRDMALRITNGKSNLQMNGDVPRFLVKSIEKGNSEVTLEPKKWTEDLHAVSFHSFSYPQPEIKVPLAWSPNCPKLSTLLLSDVSIEEIPDSFFWHMCGLKVLNLSRCEGITELPNSVSDLVNLTALILKDCRRLRSVPPLGKLKQLRDLDLSSTKIEDLPEGWESLVNLERLNLESCEGLRFVPPLGKLKQLRELNLSFTQIQDLPQGLKSLVNLERLNLRDCTHLRSVPPLGKLKQLRELDLSCTQIQDLPQGLESLVNLEGLNLEGCYGLQSVPPLGKLKQLRELNLSGTEIEDLPEGWESLVNLERLNLDECAALSQKIIPKGTFSQFHRLQELFLPPYNSVQVNDPEVLNQLKSFQGCLSFTDFYKITRWPKYYDNVYINDIFTEDPSYELDDYGDQEKQLYFHQCKLGRGSNYLPDDMKCLIIEDCEGMGIRCLSDVFRNFINLSHLSELDIKDLVGIEFLWQLSYASSSDQLEASSFSLLRDLEVLKLFRLPNLVGLFYGESEPSYLLPAGTFSSLTELKISECHNMKQLFTVQLLQSLQNLEELGVENCEGLEEIAAEGNGGGEGIQLTSSGGATATVTLPNLWRLNLTRLPQLKNVCKAAMICDSIYEIEIFNCPNLKRLPSFLPTIVGPPYLLPAGTFSTLREWSISGCHNMKQLFTVQLLQSLQNLEELGVDNCEGLEEIAAEGNGGGEGIQLTSSGGATATVTLPKLRRLNLTRLPQLKNVCKAAMICDSIYEIEIFNCPNLKRLPLFLSTIDGPPYLLPAGTFSSLKKLSISGCHNMKQLFTVQLLQNLQNLEKLEVYDCKGLEEIAADGNAVRQGGGEGIQLTSGRATANITLPKLRWLYLNGLPQLKSICKLAMICDSIYNIKIFGCPNLKRLPLFLSTIDGPPSLPSTLHKIRADEEWWESLEWDNPSAKNDLDPLFSTLQWDN